MHRVYRVARVTRHLSTALVRSREKLNLVSLGGERKVSRLGEPKFKVCILSSYIHIGTGKRTMDYNLNTINKILLYRQRLYNILVTGSSRKKIKDFFIFLFFLFFAMSHSYITHNII